MEKDVNEIAFNNPIILQQGNPFRFKIQLHSFYETLRASGAEVKFIFYFNHDEFFTVQAYNVWKLIFAFFKQF